MRTTPFINALAVITLMASAVSLTAHVIITHTEYPAPPSQPDPHQQRNHQ